MELYELVKMRGFDVRRVKIVRHQDPKYDINMLYRNGFIEEYQSVQSQDYFKKCTHI